MELKNKTWVIYSITNPITNQVVYIGQTSNYITRILSHQADSSNKGVRLLMQELCKQGINLKFKEIDKCDSLKEAIECERKWINYYNDNGTILLNSNPGAPTKPEQDKIKSVTPGLRVEVKKWAAISAKYPRQINKMFNDWLDTL